MEFRVSNRETIVGAMVLVENGRREHELEFPVREKVQNGTWHPAEEEAGDHDVGIEDCPHFAALTSRRARSTSSGVIPAFRAAS